MAEVTPCFMLQQQLCILKFRKQEERLLHHDNVEAIQLLDNGELTRRLRRMKPFELV
jgi:hypothetical protein